jgi:hypothetical protein
MFANNHHGDGHVAVWLPAAAGVQALIEEAPETYFRPPYVGASGWVGVELSKVGDEQLGALIREAFRLMDLKSTGSGRLELPWGCFPCEIWSFETVTGRIAAAASEALRAAPVTPRHPRDCSSELLIEFPWK